jgi:hypothetical protein
MNTFQVGRTYTTRSIGDHECIITVTVVARTAKTIKANLGPHRGIKTLRIGTRDGAECVKPWGSFSMAPTVQA